MADLERQLVSVGALWEVPEAPDLAPAVMAVVEAGPAPHVRRPLRRRLIALAVTLAAIGTTAAIAPARDAIRDLLGIGGVRIERVPTLPQPAFGSDFDLGDQVTLDEAGRRSPFTLRLPSVPQLGSPDAVFRRESSGLVTVLWRERVGLPRASATGAGLLMMQFEGRVLFEKLIDPAVTRIMVVDVAGAEGRWIEGNPHVIAHVGLDGDITEEKTRLAGNVLIWTRDGITYRIEGDIPRKEAIRIGASLR